MDEKELSPQPICDSKEIVNAVTLLSVEFDEFSIVEEYLSEPEETLEVSSHEPDITIVQNKYDESEKEIEVVPERPKEPEIESEEDNLWYDHDMTDSFVLEVPNELPILKEGVHAALPKAIDSPFVVDILKGKGIT
ncbi:hypothetical protein Scep_009714 [Stephania cephalantha]|uniref:Uncharacterized protein n=1 Tax=Stephania cephalantha TaxID=152367 RepID=A0AAP0PCR4_9MAGN